MSDPARTHPPQHVVDLAVEVSGCSPCRSKRGVVIFRGDDVVCHGFNYKPRAFACDGSEDCKATCRVEAVHAEQQALLSYRGLLTGADMLHVKTVNGSLVPSGGPSCAQCSKLTLVCGIAGAWLYHADGWHRYTAEEFHRLSIESDRTALAALQQQVAALTQQNEELVAKRPLAVEWQCRFMFEDQRCCGLVIDHPGDHVPAHGDGYQEQGALLAWLNGEQKQPERWGYSSSGVYRFALTGPELMRVRHGLEGHGGMHARCLAAEAQVAALTQQQEICICAAWKTVEGPIIRGHRHPHCMATIISMMLTTSRADDAQGFVTSRGRFVGREEGMALQKAAKIPSADLIRKGYADTSLRGDILFSEDLY